FRSIVSVYHVVAVCFISAVLRACICSRIWSCLLSILCLLIHLCKQFLSTLHQFLFAGFQFFNLSVCDLVCVRTFCQSLFQSIQISLNSSLVIGVNLVPCFFHGFLCLEYHSICIIFCINSLFTFLILCLILSSFSYSLVALRSE